VLENADLVASVRPLVVEIVYEYEADGSMTEKTLYQAPGIFRIPFTLTISPVYGSTASSTLDGCSPCHNSKRAPLEV